jgi:hypothetical protein
MGDRIPAIAVDPIAGLPQSQHEVAAVSGSFTDVYSFDVRGVVSKAVGVARPPLYAVTDATLAVRLDMFSGRIGIRGKAIALPPHRSTSKNKETSDE